MKYYDIIFKYLLKIPYSKVVSYSELSNIILRDKKIKIHPRVIALVLSKNQNINEYPCYKVNYKSGFVSGYVLGINEKIKRLKSEKIRIIKKNKKYYIPKEFFYYFS